MMESFQTQVPIKSLPAFSVHREFRFKETDLNDIVRTVEGVVPQYMRGDIGAKVTLSEKDLRIMADTVLMQEALVHLVKNAIDAIPTGSISKMQPLDTVMIISDPALSFPLRIPA